MSLSAHTTREPGRGKGQAPFPLERCAVALHLYSATGVARRSNERSGRAQAPTVTSMNVMGNNTGQGLRMQMPAFPPARRPCAWPRAKLAVSRHARVARSTWRGIDCTVASRVLLAPASAICTDKTPGGRAPGAEGSLPEEGGPPGPKTNKPHELT